VRLNTGASPGSEAATVRNARLGTASTTTSAWATGASSKVVAETPVRSASRM
jgi:hypothetical protein